MHDFVSDNVPTFFNSKFYVVCEIVEESCVQFDKFYLNTICVINFRHSKVIHTRAHIYTYIYIHTYIKYR